MPADYDLCVFSGDTVHRFPLPRTGEVEIGRADDAEIRINHPSVSRRHALLRLDEKLTIRDLGGANGTHLRDNRRAPRPGETENVRHLSNEESEIRVGEPVMVGVVTVVVRHAPSERTSPATTAAKESDLSRLDPGMRAVYQQAFLAAAAPISIVILGETGVGKEVMARAIHARSPRAKFPFVGLNCAALAESILESELFGHEKGAFTGALQSRPGLFEAANQGTVFLDEVGELPPTTQAKLLRVVEQRTVMRLGERKERPIDVRFLSATNRDLETAASEGSFRSDLYFRLNGISLSIPPLRARPSEIESLARAFLKQAAGELELEKSLDLAGETLDRLRSYSWPGNVRELRNAIDRAVVLCAGDTIYPEHLPAQVLRGRVPIGAGAGASTTDPAELGTTEAMLEAQLRAAERARIVGALAQCAGNQTEAAQVLGISRRTLVNRLTEFGLPRPRRPRDDE
jgi:two-component system response regulator AtoC